MTTLSSAIGGGITIGVMTIGDTRLIGTEDVRTQPELEEMAQCLTRVEQSERRSFMPRLSGKSRLSQEERAFLKEYNAQDWDQSVTGQDMENLSRLYGAIQGMGGTAFSISDDIPETQNSKALSRIVQNYNRLSAVRAMDERLLTKLEQEFLKRAEALGMRPGMQLKGLVEALKDKPRSRTTKTIQAADSSILARDGLPPENPIASGLDDVTIEMIIASEESAIQILCAAPTHLAFQQALFGLSEEEIFEIGNPKVKIAELRKRLQAETNDHQKEAINREIEYLLYIGPQISSTSSGISKYEREAMFCELFGKNAHTTDVEFLQLKLEDPSIRRKFLEHKTRVSSATITRRFIGGEFPLSSSLQKPRGLTTQQGRDGSTTFHFSQDYNDTMHLGSHRYTIADGIITKDGLVLHKAQEINQFRREFATRMGIALDHSIVIEGLLMHSDISKKIEFINHTMSLCARTSHFKLSKQEKSLIQKCAQPSLPDLKREDVEILSKIYKRACEVEMANPTLFQIHTDDIKKQEASLEITSGGHTTYFKCSAGQISRLVPINETSFWHEICGKTAISPVNLDQLRGIRGHGSKKFELSPGITLVSSDGNTFNIEFAKGFNGTLKLEGAEYEISDNTITENGIVVPLELFQPYAKNAIFGADDTRKIGAVSLGGIKLINTEQAKNIEQIQEIYDYLSAIRDSKESNPMLRLMKPKLSKEDREFLRKCDAIANAEQDSDITTQAELSRYVSGVLAGHADLRKSITLMKGTEAPKFRALKSHQESGFVVREDGKPLEYIKINGDHISTYSRRDKPGYRYCDFSRKSEHSIKLPSGIKITKDAGGKHSIDFPEDFKGTFKLGEDEYRIKNGIITKNGNVVYEKDELNAFRGALASSIGVDEINATIGGDTIDLNVLGKFAEMSSVATKMKLSSKERDFLKRHQGFLNTRDKDGKHSPLNTRDIEILTKLHHKARSQINSESQHLASGAQSEIQPPQDTATDPAKESEKPKQSHKPSLISRLRRFLPSSKGSQGIDAKDSADDLSLDSSAQLVMQTLEVRHELTDMQPSASPSASLSASLSEQLSKSQDGIGASHETQDRSMPLRAPVARHHTHSETSATTIFTPSATPGHSERHTQSTIHRATSVPVTSMAPVDSRLPDAPSAEGSKAIEIRATGTPATPTPLPQSPQIPQIPKSQTPPQPQKPSVAIAPKAGKTPEGISIVVEGGIIKSGSVGDTEITNSAKKTDTAIEVATGVWICKVGEKFRVVVDVNEFGEQVLDVGGKTLQYDKELGGFVGDLSLQELAQGTAQSIEGVEKAGVESGVYIGAGLTAKTVTSTTLRKADTATSDDAGRKKPVIKALANALEGKGVDEDKAKVMAQGIVSTLKKDQLSAINKDLTGGISAMIKNTIDILDASSRSPSSESGTKTNAFNEMSEEKLYKVGRNLGKVATGQTRSGRGQQTSHASIPQARRGAEASFAAF